MFGLEAGPRFSDQVQYIYRKQLEEADLIVINKCDLLDATRLATLHQALARDYPQTARFEVSARQGAGLEPWFDHLLQAGQSLHASMEMDYELYAAGEARLGWLNCTLHLVSSTAFDGNATVQQLAEKIQRRLSAAGAEIAHLKMTLEPDHGLGDLAVINLVRNDLVPELSHRLLDPLLSGHLIINLRAETTPELLQTAVVEAVEECDQQNPALIMKCEHMECFQPSKPAPTHRIEN
jgi:G3E family GTPase